MISVEIKGVELRFETDPSNFSPNHIDTGTRAMLSSMEFREEDKVLDLGCGYGVVGILAGRLIGCEKVILCDVSERAVTQARLNAERNGLPDRDIRRSDGFSHIPEKDFFGSQAVYRGRVPETGIRRQAGYGDQTAGLVQKQADFRLRRGENPGD